MFDHIPRQQSPVRVVYFVPIEIDGKLTGYQSITEGLMASSDPLSWGEKQVLYWCNETLKLRSVSPPCEEALDE